MLLEDSGLVGGAAYTGAAHGRAGYASARGGAIVSNSSTSKSSRRSPMVNPAGETNS